MPTTYPGRETQHDLGGGHSFTWLYNANAQLAGIVERHPKGQDAPDGAQYCGYYVAWTDLTTPTGGLICAANCHLLAGAPGTETQLATFGDAECPQCGTRGHIEAGKWVSA
jgi:hypothetical protein